MKKAFIAMVVYLAIVLVLITSVGFVRPTPNFNYTSASYIKPFSKSSTALNTGYGYGPTTQTKNGQTGDNVSYYSSGEAQIYNKLNKLVADMFKTTALQNIFYTQNFKPKASQDFNNQYKSITSGTSLSPYYAVELRYNTLQRQIVFDENGSSKEISYYSLMVVLDYNKEKGFQQVALYFVTNTSTPSISSYGSNKPMLAYANTSKLIKYIKQLSSKT